MNVHCLVNVVNTDFPLFDLNKMTKKQVTQSSGPRLLSVLCEAPQPRPLGKVTLHAKLQQYEDQGCVDVQFLS